MIGSCTRCPFVGTLRRRDLCGACYQKLWSAGALPKLSRLPRTSRPTRDCEHPGQPHRHGTRSAYVFDRCGCDDWAAANRHGARERARRKALARWNPQDYDLVDGDVVRAHLRELMAAGMGWKRIAVVAGVGSSTVYPILHGKYADNPLHPEHRPPRKQVRREVAHKLLTVRVELADGALVDGAGSRRRLQALVTIGWSQTRLAKMLGVTVTNLGKVIHGGGQLRKSTVDAVHQLYEQHWSSGPTPASRFEQAGITRAVAVATQHGWVPPLAWDDDTIDDPFAAPDIGAAVPAMAARVENALDLLDIGESPAQIALRLGVTMSALVQSIRRHAPTARAAAFERELKRGKAAA